MDTAEMAVGTPQGKSDDVVVVVGCRREPELLFLVIANISKRCNVRSLIASAVAFGAQVLLVGLPKFCIKTHAPKGLPPDFTVTRFDDLLACRDYVHSREGTLIGVEIGDDARNVDDEPFSGTCAFMPGNEGSGMSQQQKACCDSFVYISQYGGGTASLNVTVAASIVLHRYAARRIDSGSSSSSSSSGKSGSALLRKPGMLDAADKVVIAAVGGDGGGGGGVVGGVATCGHGEGDKNVHVR